MDLWWSRPGQLVIIAIRDQEPGGSQSKTQVRSSIEIHP